MLNIKKYTAFLLSTLLLVSSCKDDDIKPEQTFEKKEIMVQLADNFIVPNLSKVQTDINTLSATWQTFLNQSTQTNFDNLKESWKNAYKSFQYVKMFDFGPFADIGYSSALGVFPSDTAQIESNVLSGASDLGSAANVSAIGFSALDYLFFQENAFTNLSNSQSRKDYVSAVILKMKNETDYVVTNWPTYSTTFKDGTGTSSTSPFSMLVNAFCKDYEILKTAKVGIPLGKQSLGIQRPEYLEARNSKFGKELMIENLKALKLLYLGNSVDGSSSGKGFDDYLIALEKSSLATTIETRFDHLISEGQVWSNDMEFMLANSTSTLDDYYVYMQNSVVYMKTDMSSAFGILITYQDNDGD